MNAIKKELEEFSNAIINNTKTIVSEIDAHGHGCSAPDLEENWQ
jgi:hypothetical protein